MITVSKLAFFTVGAAAVPNKSSTQLGFVELRVNNQTALLLVLLVLLVLLLLLLQLSLLLSLLRRRWRGRKRSGAHGSHKRV